MPIISIIVPVYNVEQYLKRCLDSLIGQTLKDIEIIVINDASTDHSYAVLKQYADQDSRIKLFNNDINRGVAYTRNVGLRNAIGKYIMFCDPDDSYAINCCEYIYIYIYIDF